MWNGKKVSLIIPAYNEERGIALTLTGFNQDLFDEIIVVDNNSEDKTATVANEFKAKVVRETRQGYGAAIKRGMAEATGDLVVIIEADNSFSYQDITHLLPLSQRYDLVLGTRTKQNWEQIEVPFNFLVRSGNILLGKLVGLLWHNVFLTDVGCTYRVIRRELSQKILPRLREKGPEFSLEMILKAAGLKAKIVEIPVQYRKRVGHSKNASSLLKVLKNGIRMVVVIINIFMSRSNE